MVAGNGLGTAGTGVERLARLIRDLGDRVRRLENRRNNIIGKWVIDVDSNGNLVATDTITGVSTTLASG